MVTYQIQIPESNREAFLDILKSLQRLGVVASFRRSTENLSEPGDPLDTETLLTLLEDSEKQVEKRLLVPASEVAAFIKLWKQKKP
ncbi:MAG: hypothetical protein H6574_22260 [Lewinellaceae bacterium]|nr:hypothetical protein [Saprospiraceae bacterium]MCB9317097.1 hypothetical protein [Lewinellaceae bacterium]MCB9333788.1 hypothetical protein [Lewinellaceae bacterium]